MKTTPPELADLETQEPSAALREAHIPAEMMVLTLAWHADRGRIGERAVLAGVDHGAVELSRAAPSFLDATGRSAGPLADPRLSRAPIRVAGARGGAIVIDASATRGEVVVEGARVTGERHLTPSELALGVVIELSRTIALVLRRAPSATGGERHGLVGESRAVHALRRAVVSAARHTDPVLLIGETGTGKELVAAAIHGASERAAGPFVAVNMAALPPTTAAAELFGHSKGAFTGALGSHEGYFGRAHGGTLFLDEVGDAPAEVQPMLLRALESGSIEPVGGRGARAIDVRVLAATDHDLERAIERGSFRRPLYHRLAGQEIELAPLRARREDVMPLFVHFAGHGAAPLTTRQVRALIERPWPGNVRELRNVARAYARDGALAVAAEPEREPEASSHHRERGEELTDAEVEAALRRNGFRIAATVRELGIAKNTLYRRMERCEGLRKARDLTREEIEACRAECGGDLDAMAERLQVSERALRLRLRDLGLS